MKKLISILLAAIMCLSMLGTAFAAEFKFTDVKESDWFYNDVKNAVELGLINGKSETTYAPDDNLTYAEAIKLAACMNQLFNQGKITLEGGNPWYMPYVEYCKTENIITKDYNYDDFATRAGYMGIFANALPAEGLEEINNIPDDSIPDVPSSRAYAAGVYKLYRAGILQGVDEEHNCNPLANINRAEVAAILTRMMNPDKRVEFKMGSEEQKPEEQKPEEKPEEKTEETTALTITTQPVLTTTAKANETVTLVVEVEGGKEPYAYQWQVLREAEKNSFGDLGDRENIRGAQTAELSLTADRAIQSEFRCIITDENGDSVTTRTVIVKFEADEKATAPLAIKTQPVSVTAKSGEAVKFTVEAQDGTAPYAYQWQVKDYNIDWEDIDINWIATANDATLSFNVHQEEFENEYQYRCIITDADGNTVTSDAVKVAEKTSEAPENANGEETKPLTITSQSESGKATYGAGIVALKVEATGGKAPYTYQWYMVLPRITSGKKGTINAKIEDDGSKTVGATTATLNRVHEEAGEYVYFCEVTDADGNTTKSTRITITCDTQATGGRGSIPTGKGQYLED